MCKISYNYDFLVLKYFIKLMNLLILRQILIEIMVNIFDFNTDIFD